ncbi:uncharacterized protein LOC111712992 isoform X2 [Eurytemora carolleeae]|uniref:uncharacterized protein LOC111712992 isoform X2 n=1 Tax=Eurytemora carolleeae TaxID=1294199 RepID=UPI000C77340D|nr:uncharacterized protein LOC111712992 isoform X2 [Eurytemora carolleeae]|eukprot:XP_023343534.1 uncharacterized protein LOC111712992 isoform X2 [Eurytemora affinis]
MTNFQSVSVQTWTSFNRLHTDTNLKAVNWFLQQQQHNELQPHNILVDYGCGTGETASILGGLHLFGPCQYIGLDINLDFIQHATINYRSLNNVMYFWNKHLEDFKFLQGKVSIVTCFTVLHLLNTVEKNQVLDFLNSIVEKNGKVLVLHYLGRTQECFQAYLEVFLQLQRKVYWNPYLKSHHKSEERVELEKEDLFKISHFVPILYLTKQTYR